jgi:hypothetical protein
MGFTPRLRSPRVCRERHIDNEDLQTFSFCLWPSVAESWKSAGDIDIEMYKHNAYLAHMRVSFSSTDNVCRNNALFGRSLQGLGRVAVFLTSIVT